jgi:hypothetical protein
MAQYSVNRTSFFPGGNGDVFETNMLATADGVVVSSANPVPVTLGSDSITITGNVNVGTAVEISNDSGSPIPVNGTVTVLNNINNPLHCFILNENDTAISIDDNGGSITVDGSVSISGTPTVNIGTIPEVEIKNTTGSPISVTGTLTSEPPAGGTDAFGRQRVSEPFTLGDYKHLYGIDPNFRDTLISGGTVTHLADKAAAHMEVTSTVGSKVIHQTKYYHHYMPGKSQALLSSIRFGAAVAGIRKRTGLFDDKNGIFFEQDTSGTLAFNIRSYTSGSADDSTNRVTQDNWNVDKCDGTGASEFDLDITKTQLFFTDFQWLGVGRVRCGFVHNGVFVVAHEFYNSNIKDEVYMSTPNLPVRCEIENVSASVAGDIDQICSTVLSEGGYVEAGQDWGLASPSLRSLTNGATLPILAIRLKNAFRTYDNRMIARLMNTDILTTSENIKFSLVKLDTASGLTGGSWVSFNTESGVEYNATATAISGGDSLDAGFVVGGSQGSKKFAGTAQHTGSTAKKNYISQNFDSTDSEIYVIVATNLATSTTTVGAAMQWREIY